MFGGKLPSFAGDRHQLNAKATADVPPHFRCSHEFDVRNQDVVIAMQGQCSCNHAQRLRCVPDKQNTFQIGVNETRDPAPGIVNCLELPKRLKRPACGELACAGDFLRDPLDGLAARPS